MTLSHVVSHLPNTLYVEQEGRINVLVKTYTIHVKQQVWENPSASRMRFHAVDGDFRKLDGLWTVLPSIEGHSTLVCWFNMQPYRRAPEWAVQFVVKRYLSAMIRHLRDQAEIEGRKKA
jgi:ribosome-associated toxin RatA of RatAB toxin-antitoxin module